MKKIVYLIVGILLFCSCSSNNDSDNDSNNNSNSPIGKIKKIHNIDSQGNNYWINFSYDNNGRLNKIVHGNETGSVINQSQTILRNSSGIVINAYFVDNFSNQQITYNYTLDNNQNYLSCSIVYNPAGSPSQNNVETYIYSGGRISQINSSNGQKRKLSYDNNGNILKVETSNNGTIWNLDQISTYDDRINAIDSSDSISLWGTSDGIFNSGINNVKTRSKVGSVNYNIQYTYNNNNKPISSSFTRTSQNINVNGTREYFY
jgi:hypothetical protein